MIQCIRDLLRYDPDLRLTSRDCLNHLYLQETVPRNRIAFPTGIHTASNSSIPTMPTYINGSYPHSSTPSTSRVMLPSHALPPPPQFPEASSTHRVPYPIPIPHPPIAPPQNSHMLDYRRQHPNGAQNGAQNGVPNGVPNGVINGVRSESPVDYMDISPQVEPQPYHPPNMHDSPMVQDPTRQQESHPDVNNQATLPIQLNKLGKLSSFTFGKKHAKWGLSGMFGGDKSHQNPLPPVDETRPAVSFPSRKRAKSSSTGSRSMSESSPVREHQLPTQESRDIKKINKKEAERLHREAEQEKRKLAERKHREQARDVLHKRQQLTQKTVHDDIEWLGVGNEQPKGKQPLSGVLRQFQPPFPNYEIHEGYYPVHYPTSPSRSTPPIVHNPANSRRLPPLTTSPTPPIERWQQYYPTYPSRSTPLIVHNPANSRRLPPLTMSPTPPIEQSYPAYPSRSTPPMVHNPANSRRLPPLTTSPTPPIERWQQSSCGQPAIAFTGNSIRSPTASYPPAYVTYSTNPTNAYSYHIPHDHASSMGHQVHTAMYEEVPRIDPRSSSAYSHNSGTSHVSPPRPYTPQPISPTSPEEPTIKKKRKRADAA